MRTKIFNRKCKDANEAADYATLVQEKLVAIVHDGKDWFVFYKDIIH
jgi:hypothetical protein